MIGINCDGQVRLWINSIPIMSEPDYWVESEKVMLESLLRIISEYDPGVGILSLSASTFNEAINNIIVDLSKKNVHFTGRHNFAGKIRNDGQFNEKKSGIFSKKIKAEKMMEGDFMANQSECNIKINYDEAINSKASDLSMRKKLKSKTKIKLLKYKSPSFKPRQFEER